MAAQKGADLLMKIGGGSPVTYTTIGGLRSTSITVNDEPVDITNKDSSGNRTLLPDGGIYSVSITGSGVFTDETVETTLRDAAGAATFSSYQFIVPALATYTGTFMVTSIEYSGEYNGEVTYSCSFESSGAITVANIA